MKTTIKIVLRKKTRKDGLYPICLRITQGKKSKYIGLNMHCAENQFKDEQFKRSFNNANKRNQILLKLKTRGLEIIDEYNLKDKPFSLSDFEKKFRSNEQDDSVNAITFFDEIINEMFKAGRIGNGKAIKETKDALNKFKQGTILFREITPTFLDKFEVHMRSKGNKNGGIAFKMRELRSVFNTAINRGVINQSLYPFKKYKISKLKSQKNKRALKVEEFKSIKALDISKHPHLLEAHNYFLFSFYTRGMNFVDMMHLKWSDIQNGRIYYTRSKTKGQFNVEIIDRAQEILDYYKVQNRPTDYVFPILLRNDLTPLQIATRKHKVLSRYNKKLKEIGKLCNVEKPLTSYIARHSFATILKQMGTSTDVISELMGHSDVQITMTYLKEFDSDVLDAENRKLDNI